MTCAVCGNSTAWLVHRLAKSGKNIDLDVDWINFNKWVTEKYSKNYKLTIMSYTRRYSHLVKAENLSELANLPLTIRNNVIKSLIVLSKYNGDYVNFKSRLKQYNITFTQPNALDAFLRILSVSNTPTDSNTLAYYKSIQQYLRPNEQLYSKFLLHTGLRAVEAVNSFNLIIQLSKEGKLSEYYKEDWHCLQHFKYSKLFVRGTKNAFLSFVTKEFVNQIANSQPVSYFSIRKQLTKNNQHMRLSEFRDYFGSYMVNSKTLTEIEQNLCCGRISASIFVRHYWNAELAKLGDRIFKALEAIK